MSKDMKLLRVLTLVVAFCAVSSCVFAGYARWPEYLYHDEIYPHTVKHTVGAVKWNWSYSQQIFGWSDGDQLIAYAPAYTDPPLNFVIYYYDPNTNTLDNPVTDTDDWTDPEPLDDTFVSHWEFYKVIGGVTEQDPTYSYTVDQGDLNPHLVKGMSSADAGEWLVLWWIRDKAFMNGSYFSGIDDTPTPDDPMCVCTGWDRCGRMRLIIDSTAPVLSVRDGNQAADMDYTNDNTILKATWEASEDVSEITGYNWTLYDSSNMPVADSGLDWITYADPESNVITVSGDYQEGETYHFEIRVKNSASQSSSASTDGITVDLTAPTCNIELASSTSESPLQFNVTFSEPVNSLTAEDFSISGGQISSLTGSDASYVLSVEPQAYCNTTCTLPAGAVTDLAGNPNASSCKITVTYDGPTAYYVSRGGSDTENDGKSWDHPFATVQAGIDAAANDYTRREVWVAEGLYTESVTLKNYVFLYGGFGGDETSLVQRDWRAHETILDANGTGRVIYVDPVGVAIDGFTIRNGSADYGAGIYCPNVAPCIQNNIIQGNNATMVGGGIYLNQSSPNIINNIIRDNAAADGAGIGCVDSTAIIGNNYITGNHATNNGGAILARGDCSTFVNNTMSNNTATGDGGGIYLSDPVWVAIASNIIAHNSSGIFAPAGVVDSQNNCLYNPDGDNFAGGLIASITDKLENPQLVTSDYHIRSISPCINTGNADYASSLPYNTPDLDGDPRILEDVIDIGADEYIYSGPPTVSISDPIVDVDLVGNFPDCQGQNLIYAEYGNATFGEFAPLSDAGTNVFKLAGGLPTVRKLGTAPDDYVSLESSADKCAALSYLVPEPGSYSISGTVSYSSATTAAQLRILLTDQLPQPDGSTTSTLGTVDLTPMNQSGSFSIPSQLLTSSSRIKFVVYSVGSSEPVVVQLRGNIRRENATITNLSTVSYVLSFDKHKEIRLNDSNKSTYLAVTGGVTGTTITVSGTDSLDSRIVTVSGIGSANSGKNLGIQVNPGAAVDIHSNGNETTTSSATILIDKTAPSLTITGPTPTQTNGPPATYTLAADPDAHFIMDETNLSKYLSLTGSMSGSASISGSGATRLVTLSGFSGTGSVGISVDPGAVVDQAGNIQSYVSSSTNVSYDTVKPTVAFTLQPSPTVTKKAGELAEFYVQYGGCTAGQITLNKNNVHVITTGTVKGDEVTVDNFPGYSDIKVTNKNALGAPIGLLGTGTMKITIDPGTAVDSFGNLADGLDSVTFNVDADRPTVTATKPNYLNISGVGPTLSSTITATGCTSYNWYQKIHWVVKSGYFDNLQDGHMLTDNSNPLTWWLELIRCNGEGTVALAVDAAAATDSAQNQSLAYESEAAVIDTAAPTGTISIAEGAYTGENQVTLNLTVSDRRCPTSDIKMQFKNENGAWSTPAEPFASTKTWTLSSDDGLKRVYVRFSDPKIIPGDPNPGYYNYSSGQDYAEITKNTARPVVSISAPSSLIDGLAKFPDSQGINFLAASSYNPTTHIFTMLADTGSYTFGTSGTQPRVEKGSDHILMVPTASDWPVLSYTVQQAGTYDLSSAFSLVSSAGSVRALIFLNGDDSNPIWFDDLSSSNPMRTCSITDHTFAAGDTLRFAVDPGTSAVNDDTKLTFSLSQKSATVTKDGAVTFNLTYDGASNILLNSSNIDSYVTLNCTGGVTASSKMVSGTGTVSRTITISGIQGNGTLGITVQPGSAKSVTNLDALGAGPSATVNVDNTVPSGTITINTNNPATTTKRDVTLVLSATDSGTGAAGISQMRFRNGTSSWSDWEAYATSKAWVLADGNGTKTVDVQYRDKVGNESTAATDSITLQMSGPSFIDITATPGIVKIGDQVTITFKTSDTITSGPTVTVNGHSATAPTLQSGIYTCTYTTTYDDPGGTATIAVTATNTYGTNTTNSSALTIQPPPTISSTMVEKTMTVQLAWSCPQPVYNVELQFSADNSQWYTHNLFPMSVTSATDYRVWSMPINSTRYFRVVVHSSETDAQGYASRTVTVPISQNSYVFSATYPYTPYLKNLRRDGVAYAPAY